MTASSIEVRKRPVQARSRARVETILNTAKDIISEVGSDGLKMNALAQRAEVPIGTVYQFFPNKSAVIHTLVKATMDQVRMGLEKQFKDMQSLDDAAMRIENAVRGYCTFLNAEPMVRDILSSTQGDKNLRALDHQDSGQNGEMLFERLKIYVADSDHERFRAMCFLNMHLTGSLARLTVAIDDETAELIQTQFIASAQRDLLAFKKA